jgi:hypothetical protein
MAKKTDSTPDPEMIFSRYLASAFIAYSQGIGMDYARKKYAHLPVGPLWIEVARMVSAATAQDRIEETIVALHLNRTRQSGGRGICWNESSLPTRDAEIRRYPTKTPYSLLLRHVLVPFVERSQILIDSRNQIRTVDDLGHLTYIDLDNRCSTATNAFDLHSLNQLVR